MDLVGLLIFLDSSATTLSNCNHVALAGVFSFILLTQKILTEATREKLIRHICLCSYVKNCEIKMENLRNVWECLLISHAFNLIDEEEFVILYDLNSSKNQDFPYYKYCHFDIDTLDDADCIAELRFLENNVSFIKESLQIVENAICGNRPVAFRGRSRVYIVKTFLLSNFRSSAIFDLCQWYDKSCRMQLVLICRWFIIALPA